MHTGLSEALTEWGRAVGAAHALSTEAELRPYTANVSGIARRIAAVLRPGTPDDVCAVVRIANRHGVPLYPVSTGRNLGLGSRLPVRDDQVVLDLGRLNRIREVNVASAYAVVEPGVTQGQLADHLAAAGLPLMVNVTGAGRDTSLIGNALERGIGYFASRADSLSGMDVVLGDGRMLRTGFGHFAGAQTTHLYRQGIGPDLGALFYQSNFGVVTAAGVPLLHRRECHAAAVVSVAEAQELPRLIDALQALRTRGLIQVVAHVGNRHRTHLAVGAGVAERLAASGLAGAGLQQAVADVIREEGFGAWSAVWGVMGTRAQVRLAERETARALKGLGKLIFLDADRLRRAERLLPWLRMTRWGRRQALLLPGLKPYFGLAAGVPTDEPLKGLSWALGILPPRPGMNPDEEGWGMLYCLPFMPIGGSQARRAAELTETIYGRYGFTAYITLNLVDERVMEAVINLAFDARSPEHTRRAHAASRALHEAFMAEGWMPYRVGVQDMPLVVREDDLFWQLAGEIKSVFDPNGIIAPGRYNLK